MLSSRSSSSRTVFAKNFRPAENIYRLINCIEPAMVLRIGRDVVPKNAFSLLEFNFRQRPQSRRCSPAIKQNSF
jgi:hypothetical protein